MIEPNGKQRAALRSLAMTLQPIFQIGKGGISEEMVRSIDAALEARELIKIHVLDTADVDAREAAQILSECTDALVVQVVGAKLTLFRPSMTKPQIDWRDPNRAKTPTKAPKTAKPQAKGAKPQGKPTRTASSYAQKKPTRRGNKQ